MGEGGKREHESKPYWYQRPLGIVFLGIIITVVGFILLKIKGKQKVAKKVKREVQVAASATVWRSKKISSSSRVSSRSRRTFLTGPKKVRKKWPLSSALRGSQIHLQ